MLGLKCFLAALAKGQWGYCHGVVAIVHASVHELCNFNQISHEHSFVEP